MSKENKNQAVALVIILITVALCVFAYRCYFVVDFDKKMIFPDLDGTTVVCEENLDCRCEAGGTNCGVNPIYDCAYCDLDTNTCSHNGTDNDGDGWWVCTDARQPDCDDRDPAGFSVHPGADETANLLDDNCDSVIDEGVFAAVSSPAAVGKGSCTDCGWSGPVAVHTSPNISVVWESDEDVSVKRLRTAEIAFPATPQSTDQYIYVGPTGTSTYNMSDPFLATRGTNLAAAWIDHLGGKKLQFALYEMNPGAPALGCATWPGTQTVGPPLVCSAYPITWPANPATPYVAARPSAAEYAVAFVGETASVEDVFLARFSASTGNLTSSDGGDFIALGATSGASITDRPTVADAFGGYVVGWVENGSAIKLVYWNKSSAYDSTKVVTYQPAEFADFRDPVLVASQSDPGQDLAYLVFAARQGTDSQPEVYAVSIRLSTLLPESDPGTVFGPVLRISESRDRLSADVSAVWYDNAIGIAWSDRRSGRRIYFRRIADLEDGSGMLASDEIDLSESDTEFQGQNPSVVALASDTHYAIIWSDGTDMFIRQVEAD